MDDHFYDKDNFEKAEEGLESLKMLTTK